MAATYEDWATSSSPVNDDHWDADVVDLDALLDTRKRRGLIVGGQHYDFKEHDELSLVDQENLRRIFVRIRDVENRPGADDDGLLKRPDQLLLQRLDKTLCEIALHDVTTEVIESWTAAQRNAIRNVFFRSFDVTPYTARLFAHWLNQVRQASAAAETASVEATAAETTESEPKASPPSSTGRSKQPRISRRASASATRAA